jgi:hypothetical protein
MTTLRDAETHAVESLFLKCAHGARIIKRPIFQFSICNTIRVRVSPLAMWRYCKLKIVNLKLQIDGVQAKPALGQAFQPDTPRKRLVGA